MSLARKLSGRFAPLFSQRQSTSTRFVDAGFVEDFILQYHKKSTIQKTEGDVKLLQSFLEKKTKKNEEREVENIPADDLNTCISEFIIATEPRRPWKRLKCIEDSPGK